MGEDELSMDNILEPGEVENLFTDDYSDDTEETSLPKDNSEEQENIETTEDEDSPESVGSGIDITEDLEDTDSLEDSTSPNNFYSSIAKALKEEGIFPDLEDDIYNEIQSPDDFKDLIEYQIKQGLDERYKRINEALNMGVEPSAIQKYENALRFIDSISENQIMDESENGEKLRKNLIYQDLINRGYPKEKAEREVKKSFDSGSDIDDAKDALHSNRDFYEYNYNGLIEQARQEEFARQESINNMTMDLRNSIIEDEDYYKTFEVSKRTRNDIYNNITRPYFKDPNTGEVLTKLQKYEREHKIDFMRNIGLLFTITDGFTKMDNLIKGKVNNGIKKGLEALENKLTGTSLSGGGNLKLVSGVSEDTNSFFEGGWNVDV